MAGAYEWGDCLKATWRIASPEDMYGACAWSSATERRSLPLAWQMGYKQLVTWTKHSSEQVVATYRRADEIR